MAYQGWTNYETWNVELWINNEEALYREKIRWIRRATHITAQNVEALCRDMLPDGTPDFDDVSDFDKVNWHEIADSWLEEEAELRA